MTHLKKDSERITKCCGGPRTWASSSEDNIKLDVEGKGLKEVVWMNWFQAGDK